MNEEEKLPHISIQWHGHNFNPQILPYLEKIEFFSLYDQSLPLDAKAMTGNMRTYMGYGSSIKILLIISFFLLGKKMENTLLISV